jgi:predicted RNA-binding Zn-ribbon protein involved in translation (DUF1610 family)
MNPDTANHFDRRDALKYCPARSAKSFRSPWNGGNHFHRIACSGSERSHALVNEDSEVRQRGVWEETRECQNAQTNGSTFSCPGIGSETISRIKRFHAKRYAYMV